MLSKSEVMKEIAMAVGADYIDVKINDPLKPMKREDVSLTSEEARLYEKFMVSQVIDMAQINPVNSTKK